MRVAILAALLMLAVYTAFGVQKLANGWTSTPAQVGPAAIAALLAGKVDARCPRSRRAWPPAPNFSAGRPTPPLKPASWPCASPGRRPGPWRWCRTISSCRQPAR